MNSSRYGLDIGSGKVHCLAPGMRGWKRKIPNIRLDVIRHDSLDFRYQSCIIPTTRTFGRPQLFCSSIWLSLSHIALRLPRSLLSWTCSSLIGTLPGIATWLRNSIRIFSRSHCLTMSQRDVIWSRKFVWLLMMSASDDGHMP